MTQLFRTTHDALTFAYNHSLQQGGKVVRLAPTSFGGKGLGGLDGAAQAGMIRRNVLMMMGPEPNKLYEAAIMAQYCPRTIPCDCKRACCSGSANNQEWSNAISVLTDAAIMALSGCMSHRYMRAGIVKKYFGENVVLTDLAEICEVNYKTVIDHNQKIIAWLAGRRAHQDKQASLGLCKKAFNIIDDVLKTNNIVERENNLN